MYRRIAITAVTLALLGLMIAGPAGAQAAEDWDGIDSPAYDSAETDAANRDISSAQADREEAIQKQDELGCSLCAARGDLDEEIEAAEQATRESVAELVDARAQVIEDAPGKSEEELNGKLDALDTLESYAEEWGPGRETGGLADPEKVQAAQEAVGAQLSAVDESGGSDEGAGGGSTTAPKETTAPQETTGAGAAGSAANDPGGADQGGSDNGGGDGGGSGDDSGSNSGGPLSSLRSFNIYSLLAASLIVIGVGYYFVGLVNYVIGLFRGGLGESVKRGGSPLQAPVPNANNKPRSKPKGAPKPRPKAAPQRPTPPAEPGPDAGPELPPEPPSPVQTDESPERKSGPSKQDILDRRRRDAEARRERNQGQGGITSDELDDLFFGGSAPDPDDPDASSGSEDDEDR